MEETDGVFEFRQCATILKPTGKRAGNLQELKDALRAVSDECIFHHTYQYFLKEHILEYTNDFAHWVGESLEERSLAEMLSNVDPYESETIDELRNTLIQVIEQYLDEAPPPRDALPGDEFYFNETVSIVFPVGIRVRNLAEFFIAMQHVDLGSIYYHFYEARIRVRDRVDDFSRWMQDSLLKEGLAARIGAIDPFMHDVEGIRKHILDVVADEVRRDMEGIGVSR